MQIYVGNLPWTTTEEELREFFKDYKILGPAKVIRDHSTGRSKGYGFVEVQEGIKAIEDTDGKELKGRPLRVNKAVRKAQVTNEGA